MVRRLVFRAMGCPAARAPRGVGAVQMAKGQGVRRLHVHFGAGRRRHRHHVPPLAAEHSWALTLPVLVDQLDQLDREVDEAEPRALRNLGEHLRSAVLDMPAESRLARAFVRRARKFETGANGRSPGLWGANELGTLAA